MSKGTSRTRYGRLPVRRGPSARSGQITPATNYQLGGTTVPWVQETVGATTALGYSMPRAFDSQSFNLSYSFARVGGSFRSRRALDPYGTPSIPARGMLGTHAPRLGLLERPELPLERRQRERLQRRRDARRRRPRARERLRPATPRRSTSRRTSRCRGSSTTCSRSTRGAARAAAIAAGSGPFYVGGFIDLPVVNVVQNVLIQGGVALRGYPVVAEVGQLLRALQRRVPLPDPERRPRAVDAAHLPQPDHAARRSSTTAARSTTRHAPSSRRASAASSGST